MLVADTVRDGLRHLEYKRPDLALVDIGLPDGSGLELVERVRAADGVGSRLDPNVPLVLLTGRGAEIDRLRGLEKGADDYVVKPFSYPELRLRMAAVLRRTRERRGRGRLRVGELELDPASREVRLRGERIALSQKEFALLKALGAEPTRVFTKEELLRDVWGFRSMGTTRTLDSHACRLRHKLGTQGDRFVVNVWGVGYRLIDGPADAPSASRRRDP
jgi:DNA-binding response OmpR family regulator